MEKNSDFEMSARKRKAKKERKKKRSDSLKADDLKLVVFFCGRNQWCLHLGSGK
jgi:hypothetical protein